MDGGMDECKVGWKDGWMMEGWIDRGTGKEGGGMEGGRAGEGGMEAGRGRGMGDGTMGG